ncbi:hypothetical protein VP01_2433g3, partial [Puccinia sorghi]
YQNPNQSNGPQYSGKMYSLGWQKGCEEASKLGITFVAAMVSKDQDGNRDMFLNKTPSFANSFTWFLVLYLMNHGREEEEFYSST